MSGALAAAALALILVGSGCSDDDAAEGEAEPPVASVSMTTAPEAVECIDVPDVPGTTPAPVCALGFGIAIPQGWNATRLDAEALERLEGAALARPSFLDAARSVASTGAVFYAAGGTDAEGVSELKVDVQDDADTSFEALRDLAQTVAAQDQLTDATVVEEPAAGRVRVDYRVTLPSADSGEDIETHGSQLFVPDGDRLWSLIITSEDAQTQVELVETFSSSIAFD